MFQKKKLAIQVSLQVLDQIDTREREIGAFVKLKNLSVMRTCLLITNSEEEELDYDGSSRKRCSGLEVVIAERKQDI